MMQNIRYWGLLLTLLPLISLSAAGVAPGQSGSPDGVITVITVGSKKIDKNTETAAAKQAAIATGQQLAVAAAMEKIMPSEILTANFQLLSELPYGRAERFINTYEVLAVAEHPETYHVLMRVSISTATVQQAIKEYGILLDRKHTPAVLAVISEKQPDRPDNCWWQSAAGQAVPFTEQALAEALSSRGINLVNHDRQPVDRSFFPEDIADGKLDKDRMAQLAEAYQADFIILGRCALESAPEAADKDRKAVAIKLSARLIRGVTGEILARITDTAELTNITPDEKKSRFQAAGETMARRFSPAIVSAWENRSSASHPIVLTVQGTNYLSRLEVFRKALNTIPGLANDRINEMTLKQAILEVDYSGSAEDLAAEITARVLPSVPVKILEVSADDLRLGLPPKTRTQ